MKLWLDDVRDPGLYKHIGWHWVKTADDAIYCLKQGWVEKASLDHDLAWEHYPWNDSGEPYKERTGYDVVCWMRDNNVWPPGGVEVHSQNPVGKQKMIEVINEVYHSRFSINKPDGSSGGGD